MRLFLSGAAGGGKRHELSAVPEEVGRQITASGAGFTGTTTYTYRLDGLLDTVTLGNGETETLGYDVAHRPVSLTYAGAGSVGQEYDRAGNVTKDKRSLTGCSTADACNNDQCPASRILDTLGAK
jgi:hypothetical protein